jgi:hypothetical protein
MLSTGRLGHRRFNLQKQTDMIQRHGVACAVFPCVQCPCLTAEQQFDPLCPACKGTGRFYPPHTQFATTLLLTNETSKRTYEEPGTWTAGTIRASVLPGVRLGERDKVRLVDIRDTFGDEVLTKGIDDEVRFTAGVRLLLVVDRETTYRPGQDYTLTFPNLITWVPGGNAPAFGAQYSCKYEAQPEFLVVNDSPRLRVEHRVPQSQEVLLLRLDKIGDVP